MGTSRKAGKWINLVLATKLVEKLVERLVVGLIMVERLVCGRTCNGTVNVGRAKRRQRDIPSNCGIINVTRTLAFTYIKNRGVGNHLGGSISRRVNRISPRINWI